MYLTTRAVHVTLTCVCSSPLQPVFCSLFLKFAQGGTNDGQFLGVVALCKLASIARVKEMCVGAFYKTKHSLDLSYTSVDTRCLLMF